MKKYPVELVAEHLRLVASERAESLPDDEILPPDCCVVCSGACDAPDKKPC